jgi:membrane protease YdiL (CAAX protease family)
VKAIIDWINHYSPSQPPAKVLPLKTSNFTEDFFNTFKKVLVVKIILFLGLTLLNSYLSDRFGFSPWDQLGKNQENHPFRPYMGLWGDILFFVLFAPIFEELGYRLVLIPSKITVSVTFLIHTHLLVKNIVGHGPFSLAGQLWFGCVLLCTVVFYLTLSQYVAGFSQRYFPLFFWIVTAYFAFEHIPNYAPLQMPYFIYVLYVLPHFAFAIGAGYLYLKYQNIAVPILFHILNNALPMLIKLILPS